MGLSEIVEPLVDSGWEVAGIAESAPRKKVGFWWIKRLVNAIGMGKGGKLSAYCRTKKIPYYYMDKGSDASLEKWAKSLEPDLIVVFSISQLLRENIYLIPAKGTINLHPAFLPMYRGPDPWFWMYHDMELNPGVTVHYIDSGEDTGDIICQKKFEIPLGIKYPDFRKKAIKENGVALVLRAVEDIMRDRASRQKQPSQSPTARAGNVSIEEYLKIMDRQDWKIERLWHFLRGTEKMFNAAKKPFNKKPWVIGEYEKCDMTGYRMMDIYTEDGKIFLPCREGKIHITEVKDG